MARQISHSSIKVISRNEQISLDRQVLVEEQKQGVWLIRTITVIPDNEHWLQHPKVAADLQQALAWATAHPASDASLDSVMEKLHEGE
ncbi:hypothetical protein [Methylovulum psychrotolerans]|uniref:Uncharacterized protein n=1 Tax=Methylovulum psychrotolerans TaxID=1704499 RepID=A0A1Z4BTU3_9GAMM|nr:hypothetical protein [Methylovulum psychrotolerans]ASF44746.1 hypothetical protein CEK71_00955 [Methylovulum psychrotolerans]